MMGFDNEPLPSQGEASSVSADAWSTPHYSLICPDYNWQDRIQALLNGPTSVQYDNTPTASAQYTSTQQQLQQATQYSQLEQPIAIRYPQSDSLYRYQYTDDSSSHDRGSSAQSHYELSPSDPDTPIISVHDLSMHAATG